MTDVPAPPEDPDNPDPQPDETDGSTGFDGPPDLDPPAVQDADIYAEAAAASTAE